MTSCYILVQLKQYLLVIWDGILGDNKTLHLCSHINSMPNVGWSMPISADVARSLWSIENGINRT